MIKRIEKVRKIIKKLALDALFITNQYNVSYLTNFSGLTPNEREGFLLITKLQAYLLTFPTYFGLYKDKGNGFDVLNITFNKKLHHHLNEIIEREKIKIIGVEEESLTLSEFASLKKKFQPKADRPLAENVKFRETEGLIEKLRLVKSEQEIAVIKKAAKVTDEAFGYIKKKIRLGISEKTLAVELEYFIKKRADDTAFAPIVAFNENAAIPHYLPSKNCKLTASSLILMDFGAKVAGYCSDMTRVIFFGKPKAGVAKAYQSVLAAQELALKKLKTGLTCGAFDKSIKKILTSKGYPQFQHGLGHGVGLSIHEAPRLKTGSNEKLAENMVVTIEPGIYLEGKYGIRIEDLIVLKKGGVEILSKSPKSLKELIIL